VARGQLLIGLIIVVLSALTDLIDGAMARARGKSSRFGAFLDSTMDRVADGAVFASLAFWLVNAGRLAPAAAALVCLVAGYIVSYAKARAEGLGMSCNVGIAERAERLILVGIGALLSLFGVPYALDAALWLIAALSLITVWQRMIYVYRQAGS
jgi:CDP-diacylglycerol--glycerol-3-phosphate 3-phosphatidyltransferase